MRLTRTLSLLGLAALSLTAGFAQTMRVYQGHVITAIPSATAGDITFADGGKTLSVMGNTFATGAVDKIVVDNTSYSPATVGVTYGSDGAWVTVSADVAPLLGVTVNGAHVGVLASDALATEVTYNLTGASQNGSFYQAGRYKAVVCLDNLTLTNPDSAAVNIYNGKRIDIVVPDGTASTLTDGAGGTHKACLNVKGHAELKGGGSLTVCGNTKHAYASGEYTWLKPDFGTLTVTSAVSDGLHVDQYFKMEGGTVSVSGTGGDCIDVSVTDDTTDEYNGQVMVSGGSLTMAVTSDDVKGLKSEGATSITGGTVKATVSGLGTKGISVGGDLTISQESGNATSIEMDVTGTTYHKDEVDESKCRGIKVKGNFTFNGGNIHMTVTGKKAKGISVDGTYTYVSGTTNVVPE